MPDHAPATNGGGNGRRNPYSVAVAGVVVDAQGRALLIQRRENGLWEPPGGILERGETIEEGLRREVHEETGLDVEPGPLTGVYQNLRNDVIALAFRCNPTGGTLTVNDEASDFRWATADEIPSLTTEVFATRLLDGLTAPGTGTGAPALRWHDGTNLVPTRP